MEISLLQLISITLAVSTLAFISGGYLLSRVKFLQRSVEEQASCQIAELQKSQQELSQLLSDNISDNISDLVKNQNTEFQKLQFANSQIIERTEKHSAEAQVQMTDFVKKLMLSAIKKHSELLSSNEQLKETIEQQAKISLDMIGKVNEQIDSSINQSSDACLAELQTLASSNKQAQISTLEAIEQQAKSATEMMVKVNDQIHLSVNQNSEACSSEFQELAFTNKQAQVSQVEVITNLVQSLRVDNLVELTNDICKKNNLTIENSDFIKKLGDCKVLQIEDKHSGQLTHINYENGIKVSSNTFSGDRLKYRMDYSPEGKMLKGIEFNKDQTINFEYKYDEAGEIGQKTEYKYDANGNEANKIETVY